MLIIYFYVFVTVRCSCRFKQSWQHVLHECYNPVLEIGARTSTSSLPVCSCMYTIVIVCLLFQRKCWDFSSSHNSYTQIKNLVIHCDSIIKRSQIFFQNNVWKCQKTIAVLHNAKCEISTPCVFPRLVWHQFNLPWGGALGCSIYNAYVIGDHV